MMELEIKTNMVNHPKHYMQGKYETIEEMYLLFGHEAVKNFCKLNVYKYTSRADYKGKKEEDLKKAEWYLSTLAILDKMVEEDFSTFCKLHRNRF